MTFFDDYVLLIDYYAYFTYNLLCSLILCKKLINKLVTLHTKKCSGIFENPVLLTPRIW